MHVHTLDTAEGADRHEYGRFYCTVVGSDDSGTGITVAVGGFKLEFHNAKLQIFSDLGKLGDFQRGLERRGY